MKGKPILGHIVVKERERQTGFDGMLFSEDGVDSTIDADVILIADDIKDIKVGDVVKYPASRGTVITNSDGVEYKIVNYQSLFLIIQ